LESQILAAREILWNLLAGQPFDKIHQRANELAAFVCIQPGATPVYLRETTHQ
jgi:hypothetical protein